MGWIWNQEKKTMSRIQDSVLKKASYPWSRSATLELIRPFFKLLSFVINPFY
jgi:hypothetical protein